MPTITILGQKDFDVEEGVNLLEFLQENKYDQSLPATCGGRGTCATCAVRVTEGGGDPNANEKNMLGDRLEKAWRLSCQIDVAGDIQIEVPGYEVAEAMEIDAGLLADILAHCECCLPVDEVPSGQAITRKRVMDLRLRARALVDGGGEPGDFEVLKDMLSYMLEEGLVREIPSRHPFTEKTVRMMIQNFEKRIPGAVLA